jgi:hypothetical protein
MPSSRISIFRTTTWILGDFSDLVVDREEPRQFHLCFEVFLLCFLEFRFHIRASHLDPLTRIGSTAALIRAITALQSWSKVEIG